MKVRELIAALSKADPEMTVCEFSDIGVHEIGDVGVFRGNYKADMSPKMAWRPATGEYVGLGNPGDYEVTQRVGDCEPICDLLEQPDNQTSGI